MTRHNNEKASVIVLSSLTQAFSLLCLFVSMLCSKIKFEIDINNDELLKTIWEDTREINPRGRGEREQKKKGKANVSILKPS
jgi:hypothetical protein